MKKIYIAILFCILFGVSYTYAGLHFGGTGRVNVPNGPVIVSTNALSISFWVKGNVPTHPLYLLAKAVDKNSASFAFYSGNAKGLQFSISLNGVKKLSPDCGKTIWDGQWHFVVGTYDGVSLGISVDNTDIGSPTPLTGAITYNSNTLYFGSYDPQYYGGVFVGSLADVRIYETVLSTTSRAQLFNEKQYSSTLETPTSWWKMKEVPIGADAAPFAIVDEVGESFGQVVGTSITGDDSPLTEVFISSFPTIYFLNQNEFNAVKERVWNSVFRKVVNLDNSYFTGIATGDWALNASTTVPQWVLVSQDTTTNFACFTLSSIGHPSWNDNFRLNLANALLNEAWEDVTFPVTEFDSIDDAKRVTIFH